jgi:hypothetical protein
MSSARINLNMARIQSLSGWENSKEIRLQLTDDELRAISFNPQKCNPSGIWREGREFHLFTHAKATWHGGGWWNIVAPNRAALSKTVARLVGVWFPAPVQRELLLPKPEHAVASREVAAAALAKCREIMARPK